MLARIWNQFIRPRFYGDFHNDGYYTGGLVVAASSIKSSRSQSSKAAKADKDIYARYKPVNVFESIDGELNKTNLSNSGLIQPCDSELLIPKNRRSLNEE